jgi:uncharacterized phiE125 gp8 family phage protein
MDFATITTTEPAVEPVSLAQMKLHLRVDITEDDDLITALITAARRYCESFTGQRIIEQSLETRFEQFPHGGRPIVLPYGPTISIDAVKYIDEAAAEQTWPAAQYQTDLISKRARIRPAYNVPWPITFYDQMHAVRIEWKAGYAGQPSDPASAVPAEFGQAIKLLVGHWYEARTPVVIGSISKSLEFALESLLWSLRIRAD